MNIVVDQGNSSAKVALFEGDTLVKVFHFDALSETIVRQIMREEQPQTGMLCSVKSIDAALLSSFAAGLSSFHLLDEKTALPLTLNYRTPRTLGPDRLAAAVGAFQQRKTDNLLVIDVGTAITIDYVERGGVYCGGNISPGPELRFRALHRYTDRLPLLNEEGETPEIGFDTDTAIRAGVMEGIRRELDSYIAEYTKKHNVFTFLTGGYTFYFENKLKNPTFADENLVLKGLNEILKYQYQYE